MASCAGAPGQRVVPPQRCCVAQAKCHARERKRSPHPRARISLHAHEVGPLPLRPRIRQGTDRGWPNAESSQRLARQYHQFRRVPHRCISASSGRAMYSCVFEIGRFYSRSIFRFGHRRSRGEAFGEALRRHRIESPLRRRSCFRSGTTGFHAASKWFASERN